MRLIRKSELQLKGVHGQQTYWSWILRHIFHTGRTSRPCTKIGILEPRPCRRMRTLFWLRCEPQMWNIVVRHLEGSGK